MAFRCLHYEFEFSVILFYDWLPTKTKHPIIYSLGKKRRVHVFFTRTLVRSENKLSQQEFELGSLIPFPAL